MNLKKVLYILSILFSFALKAQEEVKKDSTKNLDITLFPVAFYTPETDFGFGALGIASFWLHGEKRSTRSSSVQLGVSYTTKNQFLLYFPFEIYSDNEKWRVIGELGYYKYVYNYYGQGITSLEEDSENYEVTFPRLRMSVLREVLPDFSVGLGYQLDNFTNLKEEEDGLLANSTVIGKDGGMVSNVGLLAFYDTRDDIFYPTKGFFIQGNFFTSSNFLGSSFKYSKFNLDSRYYKKVGKRKIIATNLFFGSSSSGTPFLDQFYIGGKRTRGFSSRRFQDNAEASLALEYRFHISGRFGAAVFGSTSTVAPNFKDLFSSPLKNSGGAGLRYIINKRDGVRLRADYGYSKEGGNISFTILEAF
ncbi:BamA/TamA family outer membrane protein [Cellulophaga sp. HaHaR_3_176]|uniref:BamA/TamA family outer membrane protein n=1 Tax=Cellulophaga sp. HaHaR_3_176 TaxID=1942464 RepID=UPI001C1FD232|nr:BamA/TamA family outer membrane protein [Cellulophaga sp. HaHaR_3_176]QWX85550.1 BamA/TamA family outer membrane protein [Cellulophaga sp. HaHaR_3_176]